MTHYKIINNENELKRFIEWLPNTKNNEQYYCSLLARSKYCKFIKTGKSQLKRFTSTKDRMFQKIQQLETPLGSYMQYNKDGSTISIPNEALSLYISPNPRDLYTATKEGAKKLVDLGFKPYGGWNPHSEIMSEIQKSRGRRLIIDIDFDVDVKSEKFLGALVHNLYDIFGDTSYYDVIETHGGYHVLIQLHKILDNQLRKTWYKRVTSLSCCDLSGDNMIPVPGTIQGGFIPVILNLH